MIKANHHKTLTRTNPDLDIVSGTEAITLPTDLITVRLVERVFGSFTRPLKYRERFDLSNETTSTTSDTLYLPEYRLEGENLILEPTPQVSVTGGIRIIYVKTATKLTAGTETSEIPDLFHDLLVDYMVMQAKRKEEHVGGGGTNVGEWVASVKEQEQDFKETIEKSSFQRDYVQPLIDGV